MKSRPGASAAELKKEKGPLFAYYSAHKACGVQRHCGTFSSSAALFPPPTWGIFQGALEYHFEGSGAAQKRCPSEELCMRALPPPPRSGISDARSINKSWSTGTTPA